MNAPAPIGHNRPPTPFDDVVSEIADLYEEARHWCDGEQIPTQDQADAVAKLMDGLRTAATKADELRKTEVKPHNDAKAAIQARYKPHLDAAARGVAACKDALGGWLRRQEAARLAAAEKARIEAEEQRAAAVAAVRASAGDLDARDEAEAQLAEAKRADAAATKLEKSRSQAKGGKRAVSVRKRYVAVVEDPRAFARFVWDMHNDELLVFLQGLAQRKVTVGLRNIPGVRVDEEETVV